MNFLQSDKRSLIVLFIAYIIANSFLLINYNGIYWDDWVLYQHNIETIMSMFSQSSGSIGILISYLHWFLLEMGIFSYRVLTVGLLFLSGVFIYKILKNICLLSNKDRFFIVACFLFAPLFSAKIALIDFPYTFFSTIFFLGFYLLAKNLNELTILKRILILLLFFSSFIVNSILVFYAIVLLYVFYMKYFTSAKSFIKDSLLFCKKNIDLIVTPIVFFLVKSICFDPSGLYANYNKISLENVLNPLLYKAAFHLSFIDPIIISLKYITPLIVVLFVILLLLSCLVSRHSSEMKKSDVYFLMVGFILFLLGSFSYVAVNKLPSLYGWNSRFQLLLPLGFSFVLYFGLKISANLLNIKDGVKNFIYGVVLISFIVFQIKDGVIYNIDWLYRESMVENFKESAIIKNNSTFIVKFDLNNKLAKKRGLGFYELNGMSKRSFNDDSRLFVTTDAEIKAFKKYSPHKQYNFSTWEESKPIYISIEDISTNRFNKSRTISIEYLLKLKYLELFDNESFKKEIVKLVTIKQL